MEWLLVICIGVGQYCQNDISARLVTEFQCKRIVETSLGQHNFTAWCVSPEGNVFPKKAATPPKKT
jgi:hypothetical protein